jgi:hypothetical protein
MVCLGLFSSLLKAGSGSGQAAARGSLSMNLWPGFSIKIQLSNGLGRQLLPEGEFLIEPWSMKHPMRRSRGEWRKLCSITNAVSGSSVVCQRPWEQEYEGLEVISSCIFRSCNRRVCLRGPIGIERLPGDDHAFCIRAICGSNRARFGDSGQ